MKTVGLVTRPNFTEGEKEARKLLTFLETKGVYVLMPIYLAETIGRPEIGVTQANMNVDFVVTLGGDGTTLHTARSIPPGIPIVPVNLQSFGFLSECEIVEAQTLLEQILADDYEVQELLRLTTRFQGSKIPDATNEVSLFPQKQGRPLSFRVKVQEDSVIKFRGDGLVIATPTGSTGHTLSLGGPVINPLVDAFLLIAAAPLRNSMLPLVIHSSSTVHVQVDKKTNLVIDGELVTPVPDEATVTVSKSEFPLLIIRRKDSFYRRLREKLLRWV